MMNDLPPHDLREVWQNQNPEDIRMSVEEMRRKAMRFERKVFCENALGYLILLAGGSFITFRFVLHGPNLLVRLGMGMFVAVMLYIGWQMHKRSPFRSVPAEMGIVSCLEFHRAELARRRDYHLRFLRLCLLPTIPGWVVMMVTAIRMHLPHLGWRLAVMNVAAALVFWTFRSESQWRARKLQDQIDELEALDEKR